MQIFKTTTISIFHFPSMMNFIWPPKTLLGHCHLMEFLLSAIYPQSKPAENSGHRSRHVSSWWSYFSLIYCAATIFFTCHYLVATLLWLSSLLCTARFLLWQLLTSTLNMEDPGKSRIWSQVLLLVRGTYHFWHHLQQSKDRLIKIQTWDLRQLCKTSRGFERYPPKIPVQ